MKRKSLIPILLGALAAAGVIAAALAAPASGTDSKQQQDGWVYGVKFTSEEVVSPTTMPKEQQDAVNKEWDRLADELQKRLDEESK